MKRDLHIRFNPQNGRHRQVSAYMELVKEKYRTALLVAAMEEYMRLHPYGIDYRELETIRKDSYHSFQPQKPIQENLREKSHQADAASPSEPMKSPAAIGPPLDSMDQVIDLYALDDEE